MPTHMKTDDDYSHCSASSHLCHLSLNIQIKLDKVPEYWCHREHPEAGKIFATASSETPTAPSAEMDPAEGRL